MSLTIYCKYKYFDYTVQRAEDRRQKFHFCRLPFAVNVMLNLSINCLFTSADLANVIVTTRFSGQAGTTMTIQCTAIGPTTSTYTWTKDHMTLQPSYRVKYDVNSTFSALTIRMTKKTDSGNYTCRVRCI